MARPKPPLQVDNTDWGQSGGPACQVLAILLNAQTVMFVPLM